MIGCDNMYIEIDHLKEGMVVGETVFLGNAVLIPAGKVLTNEIIDRVKKHRSKIINDRLKISFTPQSMFEYEFNEKWSHNSVKSSIDPSMQKQITDSLKQVMKFTNQSISIIQKCATDITNTLYWDQFQIVNGDSKEKKWNLEFNYDLASYGKQYDIYEHSLRVAEFAVVVAANYNKRLNENGITDKNEFIQLDKLATAALLHDYGCRYQDPIAMKLLSEYRLSEHLISKFNLDRNLLSKQYEAKYAPIYAFTSLPLDNTITNIILYSGENDMGTGPLNVKYSDINTTNSIKKAAGIIHLCSLYDDVLVRAVQNGLNNQGMNLENVSAVFQYAAKNGMIDEELKDIFESSIPLYSVGTRVQLSDGRFAVVTNRSNNAKFNARPSVVTTDNEDIDLSQGHLNLTIQRIVTDKENVSLLVNSIAEEQLMGISPSELDISEQGSKVI